MSFDYGSTELSIKNPFKLEGGLLCVRGIINVVLGVFLLLSTRAEVAGQPTPSEITLLIAGFVFSAVGLAATVKGLFKLFRFYVGRNVPADLPRKQHGIDVAHMLRNRVNSHFVEPAGLIGRSLHSLFPTLLFVPVPIRQVAVRAAHTFVVTLAIILLVTLAAFSAGIGVIALSDAATNWLYTAAAVGVFLLAVRNFPFAQILTDQTMNKGGIGSLGFLIFASVLAPVGLAFMELSGEFSLGAPPINSIGWLVLLSVASLLVSSTIIILAVLRSKSAKPTTEVAERIEHLEVGVHPSDLMRAIEIQLTKHRYLDIPNREYLKNQPDLNWNEGNKRGKFEGHYLVEVQPKPTNPEIFPSFRNLLLLLGLAAHGILAAVAVWLFTFLQTNDFINRVEWYEAAAIPVALSLYAQFLAKSVHVFWAEVNFVSSISFLKMEGTFTEARVATGKSIHDSTLSENTVIQSRLSYYLWVSDAITSTFAISGRQNLEQVRWLLSLNKNEALCSELDTEMHRFAAEAQKLVSVSSMEDLDNIGAIAGMNQAAKKGLKKEDMVAISEEQIMGLTSETSDR